MSEFGLDGLFNAIGGIASTAISASATKRENARNRSFQEKWNNIQQSNWQKTFDYQKYLNENQAQITATDQAKAGINPIVGAGGNVSGFSGNISPDTQGGEIPDFSGIQSAFAGLAQSYLANKQLKQQKEIAEDSLKNQKDIAENQSETQKEIARINAESSKYSVDTTTSTQKEIAGLDRISQKSIAELNTNSQKYIASQNNKTQKEIARLNNEARDRLQRLINVHEDSEEHAQALKRIQDLYNESQLNYNDRAYLQNQMVSFETTTGETRTMSLDDALKFIAYDAGMYANRTDNRLLQVLLQVFQVLTKGGSDVVGALAPRSR